MMIHRLLLIMMLLTLLTGCPWGDNFGRREIAMVTRTDTGLCFSINDVGDFRPWHLNIRPREAPEGGGFNRQLPALTVANGQLCIPDSYYHFPANGEFYVKNTLRSPTKVSQSLRLTSVFRLVNGEPQMLEPRENEF